MAETQVVGDGADPVPVRLDLTKRLAFLAALPLVPMALGAGQAIWDVERQVDAIGHMEVHLELADLTFDVVSEVGRERTLTAGALLDDALRADLDDQRAVVDRAVASLDARALELEGPDGGDLVEIRDAFDGLDDLRRAVDDGEHRETVIYDYTNTVTGPAIALLSELGHGSGVIALDRSFRRLSSLTRLVDQVAEGQALMIAMTGSDLTTSAGLYQLGKVDGQLSGVVSAVLADASPGVRDRVTAFVADPAVAAIIERRQQLVLSGDRSDIRTAGADMDELFATALELAEDTYREQSVEVTDSLVAIRSEAAAERNWRLVALVAVLTAVVLLSTWVTRRLVGDLRAISGLVAIKADAVRQLGSQLEEAADDTVHRARDVAIAGDRIAASARAVAGAVTELEAVAATVADHASDSAARASSAERTARGSVDDVAELEVASRQIGEVVELISVIAGQTNLLALNATVEAARAGNAGKGFSVVAGEVKDLAKRTSEATDSIKHRVEAIRRTSDSSSQAFAHVATGIADIAATQQEVAASFQEQASTISATSAEMANVASATTAIADQVNGIVAAAEMGHRRSGSTIQLADELGQASDRLGRLVGVRSP